MLHSLLFLAASFLHFCGTDKKTSLKKKQIQQQEQQQKSKVYKNIIFVLCRYLYFAFFIKFKHKNKAFC